MNAETIKRLEELNEIWANPSQSDPPAVDTVCEVMDHLPDLIAAVKERDELRTKLTECIGMVQRWQPGGSPPPTDEVGTIAWIMRSLESERDAAQKACAEMREFIVYEYEETMGKSLTTEEHGGQNWMWKCLQLDCGKDWVPKAELEETEKKVSEMRHRIGNIHDRLLRGAADADLRKLCEESWSEPTGAGYYHDRDIEPLLGTVNKLLTWTEMLRALPMDSATRGLHITEIEEAKQALAQFEKVKGVKVEP